MDKKIQIKNNSIINLADIPVLSICDLRLELIGSNLRPAAFFGQRQDNDNIRLYTVVADDKNSKLYISSAEFNKNETTYQSITKEIPSFHIFEREFFEEFNIKPEGHPWLKPVRKNQDNYDFFKMEGDEVHQVGVGPIHAGIIEPGHFRFMCNGETVYHLEIMLGYQHRGIENLILKKPSNQLAESVSGDSATAHNLAFSNVIEQLSDIKISKKAKLIRLLALEFERMAIHIGDLGAIAGDIGYLMGASVFGATRTLIINTMLEIAGNRFGRGLINIGGVNYDVKVSEIEKYLKTIEKVSKDVERMTKTMLKNSTVMSRLEKTGTISCEKAVEAGLVGMAARASGVDIDSRFDFNNELFYELNIQKKPFKGKGDVNSRFKLRYKEIMESISIVKKIFAKLVETADDEILADVNKPYLKNSLAISIVEGWRGELVHIAITNNEGKLSRYKIKDPSFNNWYGLAYAVRNNGISDFPLCNKSFNLSYSGFDL